MEHDENQQTRADEKSQPAFFSRGMIVGIVAIVVIAALFGTFIMTSGTGAVASIPPQTCGQSVISYLNSNRVQPGTAAELGTVTEKNGVYEIVTRYQGHEIQLYATRDCSLLFTNAIPIGTSGACNGQGTTCSPLPAQPVSTQAPPVKSSRPAVELYVMSFCPYGVQAEKVLQPVIDLLGTQADIKVRYITTVQGTSIDTVQSLHGTNEALEDARQLCIASIYPDTYWQYLSAFNDQCYPVATDPARLDACRQNVNSALGITSIVIDRCAAGNEAIELLKADESLVNKNGVSGSPTLLINGQEYHGARNPEAFKQAICEHFDVPPSECATPLSN